MGLLSQNCSQLDFTRPATNLPSGDCDLAARLKLVDVVLVAERGTVSASVTVVDVAT